MGSVSKRSRGGSKIRWYDGLVRPGSDIVNVKGEKIGRICPGGTIWMYGSMPEAILADMIGRRLSEVIVRPDLCRDVRVKAAVNSPNGDRWFIQTAGHPVLSARIGEKRKKEAARG